MLWQRGEDRDSSSDYRFDVDTPTGKMWHLRADLASPVFEEESITFLSASSLTLTSLVAALVGSQFAF